MVSGCRNCWHKVSRDKEQWSFCPIAENETAGKYWPEEDESYRTAFARTQYRYCRTPLELSKLYSSGCPILSRLL